MTAPRRRPIITVDLFQFAHMTDLQLSRLWRDAAIVALYHQGFSIRLISKAFGLTRRSIDQAIQRMEVLYRNLQIHARLDPTADRKRRHVSQSPSPGGAPQG